MKIKIGNRSIGEEEKAYIILEIARTYENNLEKAKKMIKIAAECGADAVKIQSIDAKGLLFNNEQNKEYYSKLKQLERTKEEHIELMNCCRENNIEFLPTPESFETIDLLDEIGVNAFKVASLDSVYYKFLRHMAKKNKPIILSTGMASEGEIKKAIEVMKKEGNEKIILLHCVSLYPPKIEELNLSMINRIKENFNVLPGFSDHTPDIKASLCAVSLGAKVIEKHFKIDSGEGSEWKGDYDVAITPEQLKDLVEFSEQLASAEKEKELPIREVERRKIRGRKIISNKDSSAGSQIKEEDFICLQTLDSAGIDCSKLDEIIGKILKLDIKNGEILEEKHIE